MKIGDKVVCVGGVTSPQEIACIPFVEYIESIPQLGNIYVIKGFWVDSFGSLGLKLIGCSVIYTPTGEEIGWKASHFRLLDELKQQAKQSNSHPTAK